MFVVGSNKQRYKLMLHRWLTLRRHNINSRNINIITEILTNVIIVFILNQNLQIR